MRTIAIGVAIFVTVLAAVWLGSWLFQPAQITSVENVRAQFASGYSNFNALKATAINLCAAEQAVNTATNPDTKDQRESQVEAQQQNYTRIAANYDSAMENAFAAKYVRPSDLPETAPTLAEMRLEVCK